MTAAPDEPAEPIIATHQDAVSAFAEWFSDPATRPEDVDDFGFAYRQRWRQQSDGG